MPISKIKAQMSFLLYRTDDKNIVNQFKDFNQAMNQNIKHPQDNIIFIDDPNHPEQFQIAVIINEYNSSQNYLLNKLQKDMLKYQIKTFPDIDQINVIENFIKANHGQDPENDAKYLLSTTVQPQVKAIFGNNSNFIITDVGGNKAIIAQIDYHNHGQLHIYQYANFTTQNYILMHNIDDDQINNFLQLLFELNADPTLNPNNPDFKIRIQNSLQNVVTKHIKLHHWLRVIFTSVIVVSVIAVGYLAFRHLF